MSTDPKQHRPSPSEGGDFADGERKLPEEPKGSDFARGERSLPKPDLVSDYARGERDLPPDHEGSDFARGQRTTATTKMTKIGFVGLGHMGGNMAARFLAASYPVYGEDRSREDAQALVDQGLRWCDTPRQVAEAAEIVFTSIPDDGVLEAVASGPDGILEGLAPGKVWVDVSTVSPGASRNMAGRVRARGAAMLDAPVSGSVPQVRSGTLTIMVGGDEEAYARVEPVLRELGTPTRVGDNGQGLVLKLAINLSLAVQMLAFSEGVLLAERAGLDRKLAVDVMTQSAIGSPMLKARSPLILDLPEEAWFDVRLMHKDIRLALALGRELDVPLPSTGVADRVLTTADELGYGRRDIAAMFEVLARMSEAPAVASSPEARVGS
jgi:3-hydroxyisobutyrate dehydrogenase-like beta-hydroxyacid dehydrogenase